MKRIEGINEIKKAYRKKVGALCIVALLFCDASSCYASSESVLLKEEQVSTESINEIVPIREEKKDGRYETAVIPVEPVMSQELQNQVVSISGNEDVNICSIEMPTEFPFYVDPFNMKKKGQIHSDDFTFRNTGSKDILVTISEVKCEFLNQEDFIGLDTPYEDQMGNDKKYVYMYLEAKNQDLGDGVSNNRIVMTNKDTSESFSFVLSANAVKELQGASFQVGGNLNQFSDKEWTTGDLKMDMKVSYVPYVSQNSTLSRNGLEKGISDNAYQYAFRNKNLIGSMFLTNKDEIPTLIMIDHEYNQLLEKERELTVLSDNEIVGEQISANSEEKLSEDKSQTVPEGISNNKQISNLSMEQTKEVSESINGVEENYQNQIIDTEEQTKKDNETNADVLSANEFAPIVFLPQEEDIITKMMETTKVATDITNITKMVVPTTELSQNMEEQSGSIEKQDNINREQKDTLSDNSVSISIDKAKVENISENKVGISNNELMISDNRLVISENGLQNSLIILDKDGNLTDIKGIFDLYAQVKVLYQQEEYRQKLLLIHVTANGLVPEIVNFTESNTIGMVSENAMESLEDSYFYLDEGIVTPFLQKEKEELVTESGIKQEMKSSLTEENTEVSKDMLSQLTKVTLEELEEQMKTQSRVLTEVKNLEIGPKWYLNQDMYYSANLGEEKSNRFFYYPNYETYLKEKSDEGKDSPISVLFFK